MLNYSAKLNQPFEYIQCLALFLILSYSAPLSAACCLCKRKECSFEQLASTSKESISHQILQSPETILLNYLFQQLSSFNASDFDQFSCDLSGNLEQTKYPLIGNTKLTLKVVPPQSPQAKALPPPPHHQSSPFLSLQLPAASSTSTVKPDNRKATTLPPGSPPLYLPLSEQQPSEVVRRAARAMINVTHGSILLDPSQTERSSHLLLTDSSIWRCHISRLLQSHIHWKGWLRIIHHSTCSAQSSQNQFQPGFFYPETGLFTIGADIGTDSEARFLQQQQFLQQLNSRKALILSGILQPLRAQQTNCSSPMHESQFQHYVSQAKVLEEINKFRNLRFKLSTVLSADNLIDYAFQIAVHIEPVIRLVCVLGKRKADDSDALAIISGTFVLYDLIESEPL